jgi:hypothetical protein
VVIDGQHKAHLQQLTIGRDYGTTLEVLQGLNASDWIVLNPGDSLEDGITVNVKETTPQNAAPGTGSQSPQGSNANGANGGSTVPAQPKQGANGGEKK